MHEVLPKKLQIHKITLSKEIHISLVELKGGRMKIGDKNDPWDWNRAEHEVELSDFLMAQYPVSQKLWQHFMQDAKSQSNWKGSERPVENVSWEDAQEFIRRLNYNQGLSGERAFRLPTNAEWEYAARGGVYAKGYGFSGSEALRKVGWFEENSLKQTHVCGLKFPNELGLYDLSGGLWEWCEDRFERNYYAECEQRAPLKDPKGPDKGDVRVLRGGSWSDGEQGCGVAIRSVDDPDLRLRYGGLRLSRTAW